MKRTTVLLLALLLGVPAIAQTFKDLGTMTKYEGFFDFYYSPDQDRIFLVVEKPDQQFLYVHSLSSGVGHNDLGLDRGQIGGESVVYFKKAGNRLLLIEPNLQYRAETDNEFEKRAVEEAFAKSVLHGFEIKDHKNSKYLIDISGLIFSDAHGVSGELAALKQGHYSPDPDRSAVELSRTRAFPDNVEFEALITFTGKPEGRLVGQVTPDPKHISVVQHHSFVRLPDNGYTPRVFDPRSGCIPTSFMDYASPVFESIKKRYIIRHRLDGDEPIIYYVDNGTPEPIKSALLEGGRWWADAFAEIGFENSFNVEVLPENADPLDVRYNMVQWVHRSTRGWSYGNSVVDPRTGEIIKGHVSLGSLRIRQDFMIAQALMNRPFAENDENHEAMMALALARIRQLSAHEIGHTLGFTHNFAASSNNRSSVMDYPHPMVKIVDGEISFSDAYDEGIGDWDKVTVAYAYSSFKNNEAEQLQGILTNASEKGLRFISDRDARAAGGAHPYAHLWDNGKSVLEELENVLAVRSTAMKNFSMDNIREGEPVSVLEDIFVPLYFFHRYQVEAASKLIAGVNYSYTVKGNLETDLEMVNPAVQRKAITQLVNTISPDVLKIPEEKLVLFPPRPPGYGKTRESFGGQTGVTFDYLAPAAAATNLTLALLLHPQRANRLIQQKARIPEQVGLEELISMLLENTIKQNSEQGGYESEIGHTVSFIVLDHLISLAGNDNSSPQVRAITRKQLKELQAWLEEDKSPGAVQTYRQAYIEQIKENKVLHLEHLPTIPPGAPIGMGCTQH